MYRQSKTVWFSVCVLGIVALVTACGSFTASAPPPATSQPITATQPTPPPTAQPTPTQTATQSPPQPTQPASTVTQPAQPSPTPQAQVLPPTCGSNVKATPAQTEGPYYKANPPQRASLLEPGISGTKIIVSGYVLSTACQPIANARVDFWQADSQGVYDNSGYKLRGYQLTDKEGRYTLETIVPGQYPGRTEHIHVKVQAPNQPVLTTQLYFPGVQSNSADSIYSSDLLMSVQDTPDGKRATFNFILNVR